MLRWKRWALILLVNLAVLIAGVWAVGCWAKDFNVLWPKRELGRLYLNGDKFALMVDAAPGTLYFRWGKPLPSPGSYSSLFFVRNSNESPIRGHFAFTDDGDPNFRHHMGVLMWFLEGVVCLAMLPFLISAWRTRRFERLGRCRNCGYDLRATPHRCPECGAIPQANRKKKDPFAIPQYFSKVVFRIALFDAIAMITGLWIISYTATPSLIWRGYAQTGAIWFEDRCIGCCAVDGSLCYLDDEPRGLLDGGGGEVHEIGFRPSIFAADHPTLWGKWDQAKFDDLVGRQNRWRIPFWVLDAPLLILLLGWLWWTRRGRAPV